MATLSPSIFDEDHPMDEVDLNESPLPPVTATPHPTQPLFRPAMDSRFFGCQVQRDINTGYMLLVDANGRHLGQTLVGDDDARFLKQDANGGQTAHDWAVISVYNRAVAPTLTDKDKSCPETRMGCVITPATDTSPGSVRLPTAYQVGIHITTGEPVGMYPPKRTTKDTQHETDDTFKYTEFRGLLGGGGGAAAGAGTILHAELTPDGNIGGLKELLKMSAQPVPLPVFEDWLKQNSHFRSAQDFQRACDESRNALLMGHTPKVVGLIPVLKAGEEDLPLRQRRRPQGPEDMSNPTYGQMVPQIEMGWYRGVTTAGRPYSGGFGFEAFIPPLMLLRHSPTLIAELQALAKEVKQDIIRPTMGLWACYMWTLLKRDPGHGKEAYLMQKKKGQSPDPPVPHLAIFIIYFPFWLRDAEDKSLLHYMHPFRWVSNVYRGDLERSQHFNINHSVISEGRVMAACDEARSRVEGCAEQDLVPVFPSTWDQTAMASPKGLGWAVLDDVMLAALGVGDVHQHGLPPNRNPDLVQFRVAYPQRALADAFPVQTEAFSGTVSEDFFYSNRAGPTSVFGVSKRPGPVWKCPFRLGQNAQPDEENWTEVARWEGWPLRRIIPDFIHRAIMRSLHGSVSQLMAMGCKFDLNTPYRITSDYRIQLDNVPSLLEFEALSEDEKERLRSKFGQGDYSPDEAQMPERQVSEAELNEIIQALHGWKCEQHQQWTLLYRELKDISLQDRPTEGASARNIWTLIETAITAVSDDFRRISAIRDSLPEDSDGMGSIYNMGAPLEEILVPVVARSKNIFLPADQQAWASLKHRMPPSSEGLARDVELAIKYDTVARGLTDPDMQRPFLQPMRSTLTQVLAKIESEPPQEVMEAPNRLRGFLGA